MCPPHLRLSNPVAASLRLDVVLRVPIRVEDDADVGRSQVDAHTAGPRRKEEPEAVLLRFEVVNRLLALVAADASIQALVVEVPKLAVVCERRDS